MTKGLWFCLEVVNLSLSLSPLISTYPSIHPSIVLSISSKKSSIFQPKLIKIKIKY